MGLRTYYLKYEWQQNNEKKLTIKHKAEAAAKWWTGNRSKKMSHWLDTKAHPSSDRHDEQPMSIQCANRKEMNVSFKKRRKKKKKKQWMMKMHFWVLPILVWTYICVIVEADIRSFPVPRVLGQNTWVRTSSWNKSIRTIAGTSKQM